MGRSVSRRESHSTDDLSPADRVDAFVEYADDGWVLLKNRSVEAVRDGEVCVNGRPGYTKTVIAVQTPFEQFEGGN